MDNQTEVSAPAPRVGFRQLLKNRNYRFLWTGQVISDFGDSLTTLALLIIINRLTGSAAALATMLIVLTIPQITFGLVAGVYVDRMNRKRIMIVSDLLRGALVLGFILVASPGTLWLLYVVAFVQASIGTLFTPARSALMANIVPTENLMTANSVSQVSRIIFGLAGTATAGVIIGMFDVIWPTFVMDALTFFASAALVSRIVAPAGMVAGAQASVKAIFGQLAEGLRIIKHSPTLMGTLVAGAVAMLGVGAVNVLLVPLVFNDLKVPATWFGAIEFSQTVSMVLAGSLVVVLAGKFRPTAILSACLVAIGILIAAVSRVDAIWQLLLILFAVGWFQTPMQASIATLVQTSVDDSARGRISAALNTLISTATLVSMALAGGLGEAIGVRNVFVLGGVVTVIAGFASAWVFRAYGKGARMEPEAAASPQGTLAGKPTA